MRKNKFKRKMNYNYPAAKKLIAVFMAVLFLFPATMSACTKFSKDDLQKEITIAINMSPVTMDPQMVSDVATGEIVRYLTSTLYKLDENNTPVPGIAESYEMSEDCLTVTFHLRDDVLWSNGEPVTADDFVCGLERLADPALGSNAAYMITDCCIIKNSLEVTTGKLPVGELGVSAPDKNTFIIQLEEPCPYILSLVSTLNFSPCNRAFCHRMGEKYASSPETVLSCGPFALESYEPLAKQIHLVKNPYYYDAGLSDLKGVCFQVVQNSQQAVMCYESGDMDIITIGGEMMNLAKDDPEFRMVHSAAIFYLDIGYDNPVCQNRNIRKALCKSVDRESIVNNVVRSAAPLERLIPQGFYSETDGTDFAADPHCYADDIAYDPKAAKECWEQGLKELGVSEVNLQLVYASSAEQLVEAVTDQMENNLPGLTVNLKPVTAKESMMAYSEGGYDLIASGWAADYYDPTGFLLRYLTGSGGESYSNEEFDQLYDSAQTPEMTANPDERNKVLHKAEDLLMEDAAFIPIYTNTKCFLVSKDVGNFYPVSGGDYEIPDVLSKEVK